MYYLSSPGSRGGFLTCTRVLAVLQDRDEDFHVWILDLDTNEWTRHAQTFAPDPLVEEFTWRNVRDLTQEQVRPDHTPTDPLASRLLQQCVRCASKPASEQGLYT